MAINTYFSCFIYIMNKLFKYTLVGIASIITILPCFSNATFTTVEHTYTSRVNDWHYTCANCDLVCIRNETCNNGQLVFNDDYWQYTYQIYLESPGHYDWLGLWVCTTKKTIYFTSFSNCQFTVSELTFQNYTKAQCKSEYDLIEDSECVWMDSMTCQTTYNLIPISEITPNYCAINFDMIDPSDCPINEWTWAIVRSNLMINDVPYAQNQNINVFIPDFLSWNIAFNDLYTTIEVEWYNADTDYIEDVISKEKLTPTNEDFSNMLVWLANFFPYLAIAFIMFYMVKLFYKLFK